MDQLFFETKSKYGFDETVQKLSEIASGSGWKLIHVHDLQETMRKNGKEVLPVKVVEICKPDYAYRLLSEDDQRIYSNMMPCRVSVYEKEDGQTYLSRINSALMASQIGGVVQEVMSGAFTDAEQFILMM
ncbi:MAG: DUF302 domain-containing protein [Proteiniphilum sp.]